MYCQRCLGGGAVQGVQRSERRQLPKVRGTPFRSKERCSSQQPLLSTASLMQAATCRWAGQNEAKKWN